MAEDKNLEQRIDELVGRIDSFMENGGGRMNISGGKGEPTETHCHVCCGEQGDKCPLTPAAEAEKQ